MFKFNNFKILLLLVLFAFAVKNAWAGSSTPWCDSHVYVEAINSEDGTTGGGKVYVTGEASKQTVANCKTNKLYAATLYNSHDSGKFPSDVYLAAQPDEGWEFEYWICKKKDGTYSTTNATNVNTRLDNPLPSRQRAAVSKRGGNNTGASGESTTECTDTNAIWYAYFKRVETQMVKVQSESSSLGTATIDKIANNIDDVVTLTAWCGNSNNSPRSENIMFMGWYWLNEQTGEKELVSRDCSYTFTVTEENKGTYYARFESGYYFYRIRNDDTHHYITAKAKYTGQPIASNLQNALRTQLTTNNDLSSSISDAGTMMRVYVSGTQERTGDEIWDIYVQDDNTNQYYDATPGTGIFLQIDHKTDNTYLIKGHNNTFYVIEGGDNYLSASSDFNNIRPYGKWHLEGMDKDVTTKENYFAVDPSEFIGPDEDGNYWTTLRVCFNMLYETSEITPYIVTAVDANAGTLELTEVTGGIIPEKTCVLLKCKSTDITRNVMVPTRNTSTFNTSANLLTSSTYYYKNQTVESSRNLKGIKLVDDSRLGFGGDTKTTVDGNRAYLSVVNDVALPVKIPNVTLAELLASGDTQRTYNITDLRAVELVDNDHMLICKDNNGYATKDEKGNEEYIDFMHTATLTNGISSTIPTTYDQSNWIGLRLSDGATLSYLLKTHQLKDVVGKLTNTVNPEFLLEQAPKANGELEPYTRNVYIAASFSGSNNQESLVNHNVYYFVQPKPMELANVEWSQWNGEKFIAPVANAANPTWNQAQLSGEFEFNGSYLEQGGVDLEAGHSYKMLPAIIKYKDGNYDNFDHVYVLGDVNGIGWDPKKGVEMYTSNGNIYTATVTVNASDGEYGFFSFTKKLGEWDDIKDYRFGAVADGANYYVDPNYLGMELPLAFWSSDSRSFQLAQGAYRLTVNLSTLKLVITPAQTGAPGLKGTTNGYVVYPLQINKVTTEENGVITAIDKLQAGKTVTRVVYYNLMGVESNVPHPGVNIVETRYSDGSRSVEKVIR